MLLKSIYQQPFILIRQAKLTSILKKIDILKTQIVRFTYPLRNVHTKSLTKTKRKKSVEHKIFRPTLQRLALVNSVRLISSQASRCKMDVPDFKMDL